MVRACPASHRLAAHRCGRAIAQERLISRSRYQFRLETSLPGKPIGHRDCSGTKIDLQVLLNKARAQAQVATWRTTSEPWLNLGMTAVSSAVTTVT
jgi:hypothetical protein